MTLTMRIENFDYLPDGGPLDFRVSQAGFEAGRSTSMDWTLPDTTRHISARHFEVLWKDGGYWLNDLSTNGTFVYGQTLRISSPHRLHNNDRIQVGQYIIRVLIEEQAPAFAPPVGSGWSVEQAPAQPAPAQSAPAQTTDPWNLTGAPAQPAPLPRAPAPANPLPGGQFGDSFVETPRATPAPPSEPFAPPQPPRPPQQPQPPQAPGGGASAFLEAICRGAGLPPGSLDDADPQTLGEEIGRSLRITTEELMALLSARAAAKQMVKSGSRTMVAGMNNSPLKFKPNAAEAMTTMFARPSESYLSATDSLSEGFDDIKRHQAAIYAAMQPALARLLEDLSPEAVSEKAGGGLVGAKKSRLWDTFVDRWDAKAHPHENGMLDVFLAYFAEAYDEAVRKTGK